MGRTYDDWERLVEVVLRREQLRNLALADSRSTSTASLDSDLSSGSSSQHDSTKLKLAKSANFRKQIGNVKLNAKRSNAMLKVPPIFGGFSFRTDHGKEERELKWDNDWKCGKVVPTVEEAKRRAEITRVQELHTLKGQMNSLVKAKGLHIDSVNRYGWSPGNYYR